jgi:hypothetical protein
MPALVALGILAVRFASQGPDLAVGSTVKDPWKYFTARAEARPDGRFRQTLCGLPAIDESQGTIVNYVTQFSYSARHPVALRTFSYQFDTNGTLLGVTSHWRFPLLDF